MHPIVLPALDAGARAGENQRSGSRRAGLSFVIAVIRERNMRLVTFASDRGSALGVLRGTSVVPVPDFDMLRLIEMGEAGLERARRAEGPGAPLEAVRLLA